LYKAHRDSIQEKIETIWTAAEVWPGLLEGMRQSIPYSGKENIDDIRPRVWAPLLPGLCCQAAGGELEWSITVSAAWTIYHVAAHLLDNIADQDEPEPWWATWDTGLAINVATGLIISASWTLNSLYSESPSHRAASDLVAEFHKQLVTISSGQHVDLLDKEPTTEKWWHVASAKAGAPFALACWAGARLATNEPSYLEGFRLFGHHLGLIVQVLDDARDFLPGGHNRQNKDKKPLSPWSLPIAYAMEVLPTEKRQDLSRHLSALHHDPGERDQIMEIVELSGASLYIETFLNIHFEKAVNSIDKVAVPGLAKDRLVQTVTRLIDPD
jgi:geranylgeranyl pyrophosphate synthase